MRMNKFSRHSLWLALLLPFSSVAWAPSFRPASLMSSTGRAMSPALSLSTCLATVENTMEGTGQTTQDDRGQQQQQILKPEYEAALSMILKPMHETIPEKYHDKMYPLLAHFAKEYVLACQTSFLAVNSNGHMVRHKKNAELCQPQAVVQRFLGAIQLAFQWGMPGPNQYLFPPLHKAMRGTDPANEKGNTMDLYQFGADFFRCCIDFDKSVVLGVENIDKIMHQIQEGHNVVLFANHQSEADPQVVTCLMEEKTSYGNEIVDMIFVAGHKVTTDPLAVPFSMGRNLVCIHSKKHIHTDPETKPMKQRENLRAMSALLKRFSKGGALLWIAPSGGRDRRDVNTGDIPIAPFDSKTIDMFRLIGNKSKVPTHYYTMATVSYDLCPPPDHVEAGVGEARNIRFVPTGIAVGAECDSVGGLESRHSFCQRAFDQCERDYRALWKELKH